MYNHCLKLTSSSIECNSRNDHTSNIIIQDMLPDQQLEEQVLSDCSEYLTNNLPADDVAPVMLTRNLLIPKEHDEYKP